MNSCDGWLLAGSVSQDRCEVGHVNEVATSHISSEVIGDKKKSSSRIGQ